MQVFFWGELKVLCWELEFSWSFSLSHVVVSYSRDCWENNKSSILWVLLDMEICYQEFHSATPARHQKTWRVCRSGYEAPFSDILLLLARKKSRLLFLKLAEYSPLTLDLTSNFTYWRRGFLFLFHQVSICTLTQRKFSLRVRCWILELCNGKSGNCCEVCARKRTPWLLYCFKLG